jgi:aryl-alcohol dehydrogenase-like predicted oxidoreductase
MSPGGPDGIRTRDLGLDRAACLAATPRVRAGCNIPYGELCVKESDAMQYRQLGRTNYSVSTISFGAWAIGGSWGPVDDRKSMAALEKAVELGVNFFDTADVYGDGRSEQLLARLRKEVKTPIIIATKVGRRLNPHISSGYNRNILTTFIERSLKNLDTDALDLVQMHCPPTEVYYSPEVFEIFDDLIKQGKIRCYGVSIEKVEEGLKAIENPGVQTVQIIFNMFRQRPAELLFNEAKRRGVGIIARVPLASGLLTGKMNPQSKFAQDDHRAFNRHGEEFDVGETFSGVNFETGLQAVEELRPLIPPGFTMAQFALRWILMNDAVTCAIPGAKNPDQAEQNTIAADLPPLSNETMEKIRQVYDRFIKVQVHSRW